MRTHADPSRAAASPRPAAVAAASARPASAAPAAAAGWAAPAAVPTPPAATSAAGATPVRFAATLTLTKHEVYAACEALAGAERALVRAGRPEPAAALGQLFDLLERRLAAAAATAGR